MKEVTEKNIKTELTMRDIAVFDGCMAEAMGLMQEVEEAMRKGWSTPGYCIERLSIISHLIDMAKLRLRGVDVKPEVNIAEARKEAEDFVKRNPYAYLNEIIVKAGEVYTEEELARLHMLCEHVYRHFDVIFSAIEEGTLFHGQMLLRLIQVCKGIKLMEERYLDDEEREVLNEEVSKTHA